MKKNITNSARHLFLQIRESEAEQLKSKRRKMTPWSGKDEPPFEVETPWDGKR